MVEQGGDLSGKPGGYTLSGGAGGGLSGKFGGTLSSTLGGVWGSALTCSVGNRVDVQVRLGGGGLRALVVNTEGHGFQSPF